jgi:hypothetical protein
MHSSTQQAGPCARALDLLLRGHAVLREQQAAQRELPCREDAGHLQRSVNLLEYQHQAAQQRADAYERLAGRRRALRMHTHYCLFGGSHAHQRPAGRQRASRLHAQSFHNVASFGARRPTSALPALGALCMYAQMHAMQRMHDMQRTIALVDGQGTLPSGHSKHEVQIPTTPAEAIGSNLPRM